MIPGGFGGLASSIGGLFGSIGSSGGGSTGVPGGPGIYANAKRGGYFDDIVRKAGGGYFGLDEASMPSFIHNPGYFKMMQPQAFARGGGVPRFEGGGDVLHGILGAAGSLLGNLIPIPVVGSTIGHFAGHGLADLFSGKTGDIGTDAAQDFSAPIPFIGGALGNLAARGDASKSGERGPGDMIESGISNLNPLAKMGMGAFGGGGGGDLGATSGFGFSAGGVVPVIKAGRAASSNDVAAARAKAKRAGPGTTRPLALPSAGGAGYFNGAA
jgi:hypothetical protein